MSLQCKLYRVHLTSDSSIVEATYGTYAVRGWLPNVSGRGDMLTVAAASVRDSQC